MQKASHLNDKWSEKAPPEPERHLELTDAGTNQNSNLTIEYVLCRSAVGTINSNDRERLRGGVRIKFYEVAAGPKTVLVVYLSTFHRCLSHGSDHGWPRAKTLADSTSEVTNLANVDGDVGILGSGRDGELAHEGIRIRTDNDWKAVSIPGAIASGKLQESG